MCPRSVPLLQRMGREGVTGAVDGDSPLDPCFPAGPLKDALHAALGQVPPIPLTRKEPSHLPHEGRPVPLHGQHRSVGQHHVPVLPSQGSSEHVSCAYVPGRIYFSIRRAYVTHLTPWRSLMSNVPLGRAGAVTVVGAMTLMGLSSEGHAQTGDLDVSARGGVAVPVGDLGRVADLGYGLGAGLAYPLGSGVRLRTDVEFYFHPGERVDRVIPADVNQWFVFLGGDIELAPRSSPWRVRPQLGAGVSLLGTDPLPLQFPVNGTTTSLQLDREHFAWHAGLEAEYAVSASFAPFLRVRGLFTQTGGTVAAFRGIDEEIGKSGTFVSFPLEAGFSLSF